MNLLQLTPTVGVNLDHLLRWQYRTGDPGILFLLLAGGLLCRRYTAGFLHTTD